MNTISWTEVYSIGACKISPTLRGMRNMSAPRPLPFADAPTAAYAFTSTAPSRIEQGELFMVSSSWTVTTAHNPDKSLHKGFQFSNEPSAAALLHKIVRNSVVPIYVSTIGSRTPPPGHHTLLPTGKLLIIFLPQEAGTAFRTEDISTKYMELPHSDKEGATVRLLYTKDGLWAVENELYAAAGAKL